MAREIRLDPRRAEARVRTVPCVARIASRTNRNSSTQIVPSISLSGSWLRAAGFATGKPCYVRAFARGQLVIYQPD